MALLVTAGNLLIGYALAKPRFPGRRAPFLVVLGTVTFVPQFVLISNAGPVSNAGPADSYASLVLPLLAGPFGVFLMRQLLPAIPDDLIEAARVGPPRRVAHLPARRARRWRPWSS